MAAETPVNNLLQQFPRDILGLFLSFLAPEDILRWGLTSKYFHQTLSVEDTFGVWKIIYERNITLVRPPVQSNYYTAYWIARHAMRSSHREELLETLARLGYEQALYLQVKPDDPKRQPKRDPWLVVTPGMEENEVSRSTSMNFDLIDPKLAKTIRKMQIKELNKVARTVAETGRLDIIEQLLAFGANDLEPIFELAIEFGHPEIVERMIQLGVHIYHSTTSHCASYGHVSVLEVLIRHKAPNMGSALEIGAIYGHLNLVKRVLAHYLQITTDPMTNQPSEPYKFEDALSAAARTGRVDIIDTLMEFIERHFDVPMSPIQTPASVQTHSPASVQTHSPASVQSPVQTHSQQLSPIQRINCILVAAADGGQFDLVQEMISKGGTDFGPALVKSSRNRHFETTKLLIQQNRLRSSSIGQPLIDSAAFNDSLLGVTSNNHQMIMTLLIQNGATDLNPSLVTAARNGHIHCLDVLLQAGANNLDGALFAAACLQREPIMQKLLALGADPEQITRAKERIQSEYNGMFCGM